MVRVGAVQCVATADPLPPPPLPHPLRNAANTKDREGGEYYRRMWRAALAAGPDDVTITSYNEWGESTAVEPAVPRVAQLSDGSERRCDHATLLSHRAS